jgi:hypothetical protein
VAHTLGREAAAAGAFAAAGLATALTAAGLAEAGLGDEAGILMQNDEVLHTIE